MVSSRCPRLFISWIGAASPSRAAVPPLPKAFEDISRVFAPFFAETAAERNAAGPSPITSISHASIVSHPTKPPKGEGEISQPHTKTKLVKPSSRNWYVHFTNFSGFFQTQHTLSNRIGGFSANLCGQNL